MPIPVIRERRDRMPLGAVRVRGATLPATRTLPHPGKPVQGVILKDSRAVLMGIGKLIDRSNELQFDVFWQITKSDREAQSLRD